MHNTSPIHFHFTTKHIYLPERMKLKAFIMWLFSEEGYKAEEVHYVFCNDQYLLKINMQFLKHNTFTDILTFPLSISNKMIIADIYISTERVKENVSVFKTSLKEELHRVIFHGALHLCGYKDKTKQQKTKMRQMEDYYLEKYFVSRETNESSI